MLKRNKKLISLIVFTTVLSSNIPLRATTIFAKENQPAFIQSKINQSEIMDKLGELFKENNLLVNENLKEVTQKSFNSLTKAEFIINTDELSGTNVTPQACKDLILSTLTTNLTNLSEIEFKIDKDELIMEVYISNNTNIVLNDYIKHTLDSVSTQLVVPRDALTSTQSEINLSDIDNAIPGMYNVNKIIGKSSIESNTYYNLNNLIPSATNIASYLNIGAYPLLDLSYFNSSNEELLGITVYNSKTNKHYSIKNFDTTKKILLSDMNLADELNAKITYITKDSTNTIKYYTQTQSYKKSTKVETNFNVPTLSNSINNDLEKYTGLLNLNPEFNLQEKKESLLPIIGYANNDINQKSPLLFNEDYSSFTFNNLITNKVKSIEISMLDNNGEVYTENLDEIINLNTKSFNNANSSIELKFNNISNLTSFKVTEVNGIKLSNPLLINNNKTTLDWINSEYFIKNGSNTITLSNDNETYTLSFSASVSAFNLIEKISNNLSLNDDREIILDKEASNFYIDIIANKALELSVANSVIIQGDNNLTYNYEKLNDHSFRLKFKDIPTDKDQLSNIDISFKDKEGTTHQLDYTIIKDINAPTIVLEESEKYKSIDTVNYFKGNTHGNNEISFKVNDFSGPVYISYIEKIIDENTVEVLPDYRRNTEYYSYDQESKVVKIKNIEIDNTTNYKIVLKDKFGHTMSYQYSFFADSKAPNLSIVNSNTNSYKIKSNDLFIQNNKIVDGKVKIEFTISDNEREDNITLDKTSVKFYLNNILQKELSYNEDTKVYTVSVKLDDIPLSGANISYSAKDIVNNESIDNSYKIYYIPEEITNNKVNFKISGTLENNTSAEAIIQSDTNKYELNITNKLKDNKLKIDFAKDFLNIENDIILDKINIKFNNNENSISYDGRNAVQEFDLVRGINTIKYTIEALNSEPYTGTIVFNYDYSTPTLEVIDANGSSINLSESQFISSPIKNLKILDDGYKEVANTTNLVFTNNSNGEKLTLNYSDFKIVNDYLIYTLPDTSTFKEGNYTFTYTINSSLDVKAVSNNFNNGIKSYTHSNINFIYDTTMPEIIMKNFNTSFVNCKIYSTPQNIIIGNEGSGADIEAKDNLNNELSFSYKVKNLNTGVTSNGDTLNSIPISNLGDGKYQISLTAKDKGNNVSSTYEGYFIIDRLSPTINLSGLSADDNKYYTSSVRPIVTIDDNSIISGEISVLLNGVSIKSITIDEGHIGNFSNLIDLGELYEDGRYSIRIQAKDRNNNNSTLVRNFSIDKTAPVINNLTIGGKTASSNGINYVTNHSSSILASYSDNLEDIDNIRLSLIATKDGVSRSISNGNSLTEDGDYTITVQATDVAGNNSTLYSYRVIVDTQLPEISINDVNDGHYYNKDIKPTWEVNDTKAQVSITLNGNPYDGSTITSEGNYTFKIVAVDEASNTSTKTLSFVIDKTAPKITVEGVENLGYYTSGVTPIVKWDDPDGIATTLLNNINFFGEEIKEDGSYVLFAKVVDKAGNLSDLSIKFRLNVSKPTITVLGFKNGDVLTGSVLPNFKFKDTVEYTILLNGKEYHGEELTKDGSYEFIVTAKDEDGVETTETFNFSIQNTSANVDSGSGKTSNADTVTPKEKENKSNIAIAVGSVSGLLALAALGYVIYIKTKKKE